MHRNIELFLNFLKIGVFTFGGGYAMISQVKELTIEKKKWLSENELLEMIAISESTPGPIAINIATFVGYKVGKFWGSLLATLGVVLPSLVIIFIVSLFFNSFIQNKYVAYAFLGIKCAVAFLITKTAIEMILKIKKTAFNIILLTLVTITMIIIDLFSINFSSIYLIIAGGIIGIFYYTFFFKRKEIK